MKRRMRFWFRAAFGKSNKVSRGRNAASLDDCYVLAANYTRPALLASSRPAYFVKVVGQVVG